MLNEVIMVQWSVVGYWTLACVLIILNAGGLFANLLLLPGNWLMVGGMAIFLLATDFDHGPTWVVLVISFGLAGLGELLELLMGSAKAAKKGASRRAMLLSLLLSFVGSIVGTFLIPIPLLGSVIGAILGAAIGAFAGAWLGEAWKGTESSLRTEIGTAAMSGRLLGMLAKFAVGAAIFAIQLISLLFS